MSCAGWIITSSTQMTCLQSSTKRFERYRRALGGDLAERFATCTWLASSIVSGFHPRRTWPEDSVDISVADVDGGPRSAIVCSGMRFPALVITRVLRPTLIILSVT